MATPGAKSSRNSETFYAVFVPGHSPTPEKGEKGKKSDASTENDDADGDSLLVFREMKEALEAIKKFKDKSPRFKNFSKYDEAVRYCRDGDGVICGSEVGSNNFPDGRPPTPRPATPVAAADELPRPFPAVSAPELTKFRKAIEMKNIDKVMEFVESNPRYLINCNGDTPSILHAGCRYNSLHVAARVGHLESAKYILELFADDSNDDNRRSTAFIRRLYPDDRTEETTRNRRRILLDFYLNTPDYGFNETPLHFAAKIGYVEIVKYLCSFDECQRSLVNKSGQTAKDLTEESDRVNQKVKAEIIRFLEHGAPVSYFVPLYRARDEVNAPILRHPSAGYPPKKHLLNKLDDHGEQEVNKNSISSIIDYRLAAYIGPVEDEAAAEKVYNQWSSNQRTPPSTNKTATTGKGKGKKKITSTTKVESQSSAARVVSNPADVKRSDLHKGMECVGRRVAANENYPWMEYWHFLGQFADLRTESGLALLERYFYQKASQLENDDHARRMIESKFSSAAVADGTTRESCRKKLDFSDMAASDEVGGGGDDESSRDSADLYFDAKDDDGGDYEIAAASGRNSSAKNSPRRQPPWAHDEEGDETTRDGYSTPPQELTANVIFGLELTKLDRDVYAALDGVKVNENRFPRTAAWLKMVGEYSDQERRQWLPLDSPRSAASARKMKH